MKRFVIFCVGRSGSRLLTSLLHAHRSIYCEGEIFGAHHLGRMGVLSSFAQHHPVAYILCRQLRARFLKRTLMYGFKVQFQQLANPREFIVDFHANGGFILYLQRRSVFEQVVSAEVARYTRRYHGRVGRDEPVLAPFSIDPAQFLDALRTRQERIRRCQEAAAAVPHLPLVYEDDLASPDRWDATVASICTYLEIEKPASAVTTQLRPPWRRPYSELISNYAELQTLAGE